MRGLVLLGLLVGCGSSAAKNVGDAEGTSECMLEECEFKYSDFGGESLGQGSTSADDPYCFRTSNGSDILSRDSCGRTCARCVDKEGRRLLSDCQHGRTVCVSDCAQCPQPRRF